MGRSLLSVKIFIVTLICALFFIAIPVHSIKYEVTFDPDKLFMPCDGIDTIDTFINISQVDIHSEADDTVSVKGKTHLVNPAVTKTDKIVVCIRKIAFVFSSFYKKLYILKQVFTTVKQKTRGRWMDTPFTNLIKDFCAQYVDPKEWWYDHITKYFVGEQLECPPKVNVNVEPKYACR